MFQVFSFALFIYLSLPLLFCLRLNLCCQLVNTHSVYYFDLLFLFLLYSSHFSILQATVVS